MIECANSKCAVKWFHLHCVGLSQKLHGLWICPDCARGDYLWKFREARHMVSLPWSQLWNNDCMQE